MKLGITEYVDCAHFLPDHCKCGRLHGHTYTIEVTIEGDHKKGMLMDFADFRKGVREVLAVYDHQCWNDFLPYPSVENICVLVSQSLKERLAFPFVLRVWEGHGKWAETSSDAL